MLSSLFDSEINKWQQNGEKERFESELMWFLTKIEAFVFDD